MDGSGVRAEQALLGAVLLDPAGQAQVLDLVEPGDMGRPWHGQVLAAMRRVRTRGGAPGLGDAYVELENDPALPPGVARDAVPLADLLQVAPQARHAGAYAAIVVEGGIRRQLDLAGSRVTQAGESGDLEAVLSQAGRARRIVNACAVRWLALPGHLRREAAPSPRGSGREGAAAGGAAAVRDEGRYPRADRQAGRAVAEEWTAVTVAGCGPVAVTCVRERVRQPGAGEEAAGLAVLRNLAAGRSQIALVRGWLRPEHFAVAGHGEVYALMRDMDGAGMPVDPVTVSWEATRRGLPADPTGFAGGTGAFAVASARQVHRFGLLAQAVQAGRDIQADAADLNCTPRHLLLSGHKRARALETELQPQARPGRNAATAGPPGRRAMGGQTVPEREAVP